MSKDNEAFEELTAALAADPAINAAVADHNAACEEDDEALCVVCNAKKALGALMYVSHALEHSAAHSAEGQCTDSDCEETTELDLAMAMVFDLESALTIISACQTGIKLLADISNAAAFIIHEEELGEDEDDDI